MPSGIYNHKPLSEETKTKISKRTRGVNNPMFGKCHTDESKRKNSEAHKGKKISLETRKKISESLKGRVISGETRKKLSILNTGKHLKISTKIKLRKFNKGKNIRDKHWNWKGGVTPLLMQIRNSSECKEWREKVFKRDNYTCQKTKIKGCKLEAHHLKSFTKILEENNIETLEQAKLCKELWDINNGITLSEKCHTLFHKQYGLRNNTKEQIEKFLLTKVK